MVSMREAGDDVPSMVDIEGMTDAELREAARQGELRVRRKIDAIVESMFKEYTRKLGGDIWYQEIARGAFYAGVEAVLKMLEKTSGSTADINGREVG